MHEYDGWLFLPIFVFPQKMKNDNILHYHNILYAYKCIVARKWRHSITWPIIEPCTLCVSLCIQTKFYWIYTHTTQIKNINNSNNNNVSVVYYRSNILTSFGGESVVTKVVSLKPVFSTWTTNVKNKTK